MSTPLNAEKSKQLRPLRIVLAVLVVVLFAIILNRLPTSKTTATRTKTELEQSAEPSSDENDLLTEEKSFYYLNGFLEILEAELEEKLVALGVPEEDFENVSEYFTKDELLELETKVTLASSLETDYVLATSSELSRLKTIFHLNSDYSFSSKKISTTPSDYKNLSDLLSDYDRTLNTVEDYDVVE